MDATLQEVLTTRIGTLPADVTVGAVVMDGGGVVLFSHNASLALPSASSIKAPLLLELFAKHAGDLHTAGRRDIRRVVEDDGHPAVTHFSPEVKREIAENLSGVSIKRLGHILIESKDETGAEYSNKVYNAAASVAIALLGGPAAATEAIHRRHDSFTGAHLRRYMLADRTVTGDNTATPATLASFYQVALGTPPPVGVEAGVIEAVAEVLQTTDADDGARHYGKTGVLDTDPVTSVRAGQYRVGEHARNYAFMAAQPLHAPPTGKEQHEALSTLTRQLRDAASPRGWQA